MSQVAGYSTPQLYLSFPPAAQEPPQVMRGFDKVYLKPGQSAKITFPLRRKDMSIYDVQSKSWKVVPGKYTVKVGNDSRDPKSQSAWFKV